MSRTSGAASEVSHYTYHGARGGTRAPHGLSPERHEAMRDLSRARQAVKKDLQSKRQQIIDAPEWSPAEVVAALQAVGGLISLRLWGCWPRSVISLAFKIRAS